MGALDEASCFCTRPCRPISRHLPTVKRHRLKEGPRIIPLTFHRRPDAPPRAGDDLVEGPVGGPNCGEAPRFKRGDGGHHPGQGGPGSVLKVEMTAQPWCLTYVKIGSCGLHARRISTFRTPPQCLRATNCDKLSDRGMSSNGKQIPRCLRRNSRQGKQPYSRCCSLGPRAFSSQILG